MILNCQQCEASYILPASTFAMGARNVRCVRCGHVWLADLPVPVQAVAWPEAPAMPVLADPPPPPPHKIVANDTDLSSLAKQGMDGVDVTPFTDILEGRFEEEVQKQDAPQVQKALETQIEAPQATQNGCALGDLAAKNETPVAAEFEALVNALKAIHEQGLSPDEIPMPGESSLTIPPAIANRTIVSPAISEAVCATPAATLPRPDVSTVEIRKKTSMRPRLPALWRDPRLARFVARARMAAALVFLATVLALLAVSFWGQRVYVRDMLQSVSVDGVMANLPPLPSFTILPNLAASRRGSITALSPSRALKFLSVTSERRYENGTINLVVEGEIHNPTGHDVALPGLRVSALNAEGAVMETWTLPPPQPVVPGQGLVPFRTSIAAPDGVVVEVNLRFLSPDEPVPAPTPSLAPAAVEPAPIPTPPEAAEQAPPAELLPAPTAEAAPDSEEPPPSDAVVP